MGDPFVEVALLHQRVPEGVVHKPVQLGDTQCMRAERRGIRPIPQLGTGGRGKERQYHDRAASPQECRRPPSSQEIGRTPDQRDEEPDRRKVGEAIGHRLVARLDETAHREERGDEPEPPDQHVGEPVAGNDGDRGDPAEKERAAEDVCHGRHDGQGIEHREPARPEGLSEIARIRDDGVRETGRRREIVHGREGRAADEQSDSGRQRGHTQHGELLGEERLQPGSVEPAQRPVVEQEEKEG